MKKTKIAVTKTNNQIYFYLCNSKGTAYLFSQEYTKGVYDFFRRGRSDTELRKFHNWGKNPRLDHTIERCMNPNYRRCVLGKLIA